MSVLNYGLLHEYITVAYFVFLRRQVVSSVLKCGLFQLAKRVTLHNVLKI